MRAWTSGQSDYESGASRLARAVVPDTALVTWLPYLLPRAVRLARRERFDCVITTSGPESVHLAGLALRAAARPGSRTCATGGASRPSTRWPTAGQARLDRALERLVARRADLMTAVSEPLAADLRTRLGADAHTVTNGFDPDEVPERTGSSPLLDPAKRSLAHTGRMASGPRRLPEPLLEALSACAREHSAGERLELDFRAADLRKSALSSRRPTWPEQCARVGNLDRDAALRLQREADGLLLLTAGTRRGEATGKLFEYLGAERPILVLGEDTEAARIVGAAGVGVAAPSADPEAIAAALERLPESVPAAAPRAYSYPELAWRYAELVELARERARKRTR